MAAEGAGSSEERDYFQKTDQWDKKLHRFAGRYSANFTKIRTVASEAETSRSQQIHGLGATVTVRKLRPS